jgi:hypothetical protein
MYTLSRIWFMADNTTLAVCSKNKSGAENHSCEL